MSEKPCNICERCGKTFKYPSLLKNHLAAKKSCVVVTKPVDVKSESEELEVAKVIDKTDNIVKKKNKVYYENTDSEEESENTSDESDNSDESGDKTKINKEVKSFNEFLEAYTGHIKKDVVKFINRDIARTELVKTMSSVRFNFACRTSLFNLYPEDDSIEIISKIVKTIEALMKYDKMERSDEFHICQCNICKYIFLYPRNAEVEAFCMDCMLRSKVLNLLEEDKLPEAIEVQREYLEHLYNHRLGDILYRVGKLVNKQDSLIEEDRELNDQKKKLTNEVMAIVQARNLLPTSHITVDTKTTTSHPQTNQQAANGFNWQQFQQQFQNPQFMQQAQQQQANTQTQQQQAKLLAQQQAQQAKLLAQQQAKQQAKPKTKK